MFRIFSESYLEFLSVELHDIVNLVSEGTEISRNNSASSITLEITAFKDHDDFKIVRI